MDLPQHRTTDQHFMSVMCELLVRQNDLLVAIRDRLPEQEPDGQPARGDEGGAVVLKEPAAPPRAAATPDTVELSEPGQPTPDATAPAPNRAARRTPAKKSTASRRTPKGTS